MIYILYSSDYEVYLGGNRVSEPEVLIDTTEWLLSGCDAAGIPMTLFCDLACLWRYRELWDNELPDLAEMQLRSARKRGHDVQAHLHPHWFNTDITRDSQGATRYDFDPEMFLLGNWRMKDGVSRRQFCAELLSRAKSYLEELLRPIDCNYRCVAFRAGGFGLQPKTEDILAALRDVGFVIDSSVVPGLVIENNVNHVDFSNVPKQGNYYVVAADREITVGKGGVYEIPIAALWPGDGRWPLSKALVARSIRRLTRQGGFPSRGYTIQSTNQPMGASSPLTVFIHYLKGVLRGGVMLELRREVNVMVDVTRRYISQEHNQDSDLYFAFLCHSKSTDPRMVEALIEYHQRISKIYGSDVKAITFQDAAQRLALSGEGAR